MRLCSPRKSCRDCRDHATCCRHGFVARRRGAHPELHCMRIGDGPRKPGECDRPRRRGTTSLILKVLESSDLFFCPPPPTNKPHGTNFCCSQYFQLRAPLLYTKSVNAFLRSSWARQHQRPYASSASNANFNEPPPYHLASVGRRSVRGTSSRWRRCSA